MHKDYLEKVISFCNNKGLTLILKGSLANGTAQKNSDIDLIIMGNLNNVIIDEIITIYDKPIMTNYTENPIGIMILVYNVNVSVDLDIRTSITEEELVDDVILIKGTEPIVISKLPERSVIETEYIPIRPDWYKVLRLVHRSLLKHLSGKYDDAIELAHEAREKMSKDLLIELDGNKNYQIDIYNIYSAVRNQFEVSPEMNNLFTKLLKEIL